MADLRYKATVDVADAERSLGRLQRSVAGINDTFIRLKTTLASISLGAVISQSLQFADSVADLSDATGIAIDKILGFQAAVAASGGSVDGAQKALLRLVNSIGDAADGSLQAQNAFANVGVTLSDLANLSEEDILQKTIQGLDKITDAGKRSLLVTQLLGKEFRNVAPGQLAQAYAAASASSAQYADAIKAGAAAQQNIDKTLTDFKIGLLAALKPINDLISRINVSVDTFQRFVQAVLAVGAVLASVFVGGKIIGALKLFYNSLLAIGGGAAGLFELLKNLVTGFGAIWRATEGAGGALYRVWLAIKAVGVAIAEIGGPAWTALKTVATPVLATLAGWWGWLQESTQSAIDKLIGYGRAAKQVASDLTFGLISPPEPRDSREGMRGRGDPAEIANREAEAKRLEGEKQRLREVKDALEKRRKEIEKTSEAFRRQNADIIDNLNLEKGYVTMTEDAVEVERAREDVFKRAAAESLKLREAKAALGKDEQGLAATYDRQIAAIQKAAEEDAKRIAAGVVGLQGVRLVEQARKQDIENTTKAIEAQIARQQQLGEILRGINDRKVDLGFEKSLKGLSPLQKEVARINEEARKAALEAGRAFAAGFETEDGLTPERAQELADGLAQIAQGYRDIAQAQIEGLGPMDEFTNGLAGAWQTYKDNAQDIAGQVKDSFNNFTQGMEDAFVRFVQTGKLSFKDLANSILADLARIAVKKAMVFLGTSLFGFANGGQVMADTPIVVGERGPELFVPKTAGTIVSNAKLNSSSQSEGRGNTAVTYNINAVDAASFRSLVARDPSFIYAVTEKGRQSQPTRRTI